MDQIGTNDTLPVEVRRDLARLVDMVFAAPQEFYELARLDGTAERLARIVDWLYSSWYTQQPDGQSVDPPGHLPPDLRSALAVASAASRPWQRGWVVLQADPSGICLAGLKQINRWLYPGQYANIARPGLPPAPGDSLSVNNLVSDVDEGTGFWISQSAIGTPTPPLIRLYFNVGWQHAGPVLGEVTAWLEQAGAKYSLKYPTMPDTTQRVDTLVAYVERSQWGALESAAIALAQRLGEHLRPATPPLTRHLASGAGCADDPGAGASFGQSRCLALAPAVLKLIEHGPATKQEALVKLVEALDSASIDPQKPWEVRPT